MQFHFYFVNEALHRAMFRQQSQLDKMHRLLRWYWWKWHPWLFICLEIQTNDKHILQIHAISNSLICILKILCNSVNDADKKGTSTWQSDSPTQWKEFQTSVNEDRILKDWQILCSKFHNLDEIISVICVPCSDKCSF